MYISMLGDSAVVFRHLSVLDVDTPGDDPSTQYRDDANYTGG